MFKEFKTFIAQGDVLNLAVGVIIGGAFGKITSSLVADIIMPIIGIAMGKVDFKSLSIEIGEAKIMYGNFMQTVIDFLILAYVVFLIVKAATKVGVTKA
jgi:large conductance mechanosensitive channel